MSVNESVTDQVDAMRQGTLRPTTLVDQAITRIGQLNPAVNAVITMAEARAREEAAAWDLAWSTGDDLPPLAGVPVLIKDNQRTEGIRTTLGSSRFLDQVPEVDAGIVARLRAAGAIILGKTNIPEYLSLIHI